MPAFGGFPPGTRFAGVPAAFFADLLPQITDDAELRVSLQLFWLLSQQRRRPKAVSRSELLASIEQARLMPGGQPAVDRGLQEAVQRGTFLVAAAPEGHQSYYLLNTALNRRERDLIASGRLRLADPASTPALAGPTPRQRPNVYQLYEENIGLITPLLAEELRDAEARYPADWLEEAIRRAVERNCRRWSYVAAILRGWETEGFHAPIPEPGAPSSGARRAAG